MKDEFKIEGYWFLPANPENRVAGILHYVPNGEIRLQLIGSFDTPGNYLTSKVERKKNSQFIIHVESSSARKITLINCYFGKSSYNFSCSFPMQSFMVQFILDGIYIKDVDEEVFDKITFSMPYLTEWINHYSLGLSIPYKDDRPQGFVFKYDKDRSNLISAKLNSNLSLKIEYVCSHGDFYSEQVAITQVYYLRIISTNNLPFFKLLSLADRFQDFLSLAAESKVDFNFLSLRCPTLYQELKDGTKVYHPVQLYFSQKPGSNMKIKIRDFLFTHDQLSGNFGKIIKIWYKFDDNMLPILQHLIQSIQPNDFFSKSDFLIVVQALEGFHTRFRDKRKKYLIDRLKSIQQEFSFIDQIRNIKLDLKITVDSRHYYSHFFHKSQKEHIADGLELYNITKMLKALLVCCILKESGFEDSTIKSIIDDNEQILQLANMGEDASAN